MNRPRSSTATPSVVCPAVLAMADYQVVRIDDAQEQHACLVPHANLPESEKEYGRKSAKETLKAVVAPGYAISPNAQRDKDLTHLRRSLELYTEACDRFGGYRAGVNAATLALLLADKDRATSLAGRVDERTLSELEMAKAQGGDTYWPLATPGEAALVLGELAAAEDWYGRAAEVARSDGRYGDLTATRQQARLLLEHLGADVGMLDRCFQIPRVAVFTGHMIDRPGRTSPRFPPRLEGAVRAALGERLERSGIRIGYASAACGSDILFLEEVLKRGGEAHVVLPYDRDRFLADSVEILPDSDWGERCRRVLALAEVTTASDQRLAVGGISYAYANMILHGLATLRADHLDTDLVALAVWDGRAGDGPGGTANTVARWQSTGLAVDVIDLTEILHYVGQTPLAKRPWHLSDLSRPPPRLRTMKTGIRSNCRAVPVTTLGRSSSGRSLHHRPQAKIPLTG